VIQQGLRDTGQSIEAPREKPERRQEKRKEVYKQTHTGNRAFYGQLRANAPNLKQFPSPPHPPIIMKIISWNIRGLNGRRKQKSLRDLIFAEKPDVLLLQETKCSNEDLNKLLSYCWKQGEAVSTAAAGTAGGLVVLWNPATVQLENFTTTRWSITTDYRPIGSNKPGHITNVYGPANPREK